MINPISISNPVSSTVRLYTDVMGSSPMGSSIFGLDYWGSPGASYVLSPGGPATRIVRIGATLAINDVIARKLYPGQADKRKHVLAGGLVAGAAGEIAANLIGDRTKSALIAVAAGAVVGLGKEIADMMGYGTPDKHDFFATVLGAATVGVVVGFPL